jgi:copper(I)-binding protein
MTHFPLKGNPMKSISRRTAALAALCLCCALPAAAGDYKLGPLTIDHPWARPTAPGQSVGGAYLGLRNGGTTPDRLLGGSTATAARVEVHEMRMEGDVMRMREIQAIELPAGKGVKLEPGGLHLMLMGLKAPLKVGDKLPLKLRFEKAGEVEVMLVVESKPASAADGHKH